MLKPKLPTNPIFKGGPGRYNLNGVTVEPRFIVEPIPFREGSGIRHAAAVTVILVPVDESSEERTTGSAS